MVEDAYISFEVALHHHGLYDQLLANINSISLKQYKSTTIEGITYNFIKTQQHYFYGWDEHVIDGQSVKIASPEKALIDLLQFHRSRYSVDLVLEKLRDFRDDLSQEKLIQFALQTNLTTRRVLGFLLDCIEADSSQLHTSVLGRKSTTSISKTEEKRYNHKWRLYYDPYFARYIHE